MYEDLAIKLGRINGLEDYYDISNYDYDPHCLYEDLKYGFDRTHDNKFIFLNFDKEEIVLQKIMMIMNIILLSRFLKISLKNIQTIHLNLEWKRIDCLYFIK